jgi:hypothetical protein
MPFFLFFDTPTMHIKSIVYQQHCYDFLKNLIPWQDSNPGLLFLRQMRCRLPPIESLIPEKMIKSLACSSSQMSLSTDVMRAVRLKSTLAVAGEVAISGPLQEFHGEVHHNLK